VPAGTPRLEGHRLQRQAQRSDPADRRVRVQAPQARAATTTADSSPSTTLRNLQVGAHAQQLELASRARRPDGREGRQRPQQMPVAGDEHVPPILAARIRTDRQPIDRVSRQVLGRVHREIARPVRDGRADRVDEQSLGLERLHRPVGVQDAVLRISLGVHAGTARGATNTNERSRRRYDQSLHRSAST